MPTTSPLPYSKVLEAYDRAKQLYPEKFGNSSLQDFAATANRETGTDMYTAGLTDNWVKRSSARFDQLLAPVARPTGQFVGGVVGAIDPTLQQIGQQVGESLPRSAIELGLAAAGGIPGLIAGGASAGAGAYEKTGSIPAGLVGAATTAAMPGMARLGSETAAKLLAPTALARSGMGAQLLERGAESLGANTFAALTGEAGRQGTSLVTGQGFAPVGTKEHIAEAVISQVPFAAMESLGFFKPPGTVTEGGVTRRLPRSGAEEQAIRSQVQAESRARESAIKGQQGGQGGEPTPPLPASPSPAGGPAMGLPANAPAPASGPIPDPFKITNFKNDPQILDALQRFAAAHPEAVPTKQYASDVIRRVGERQGMGSPVPQVGSQATGPSLYRESSAFDALSFVSPNVGADVPFGSPDYYFATSPDLAIGQGSNRSGIIVEVGSGGLKTSEVQKPGLDFVNSIGGGNEMRVREQPSTIRNNVRSITIPDKLAKDPNSIALVRHLKHNWTAQKVEGGTKYTPNLGRKAAIGNPQGTPEQQFVFQAEQLKGLSESTFADIFDKPIGPDEFNKIKMLSTLYDNVIESALTRGDVSHMARAVVKEHFSKENLVDQMIHAANTTGLDAAEFGQRLINRMLRITKDVVEKELARTEGGDNPYVLAARSNSQAQRILDSLKDLQLFDKPENQHLVDGLQDVYERTNARLEKTFTSGVGRAAYDEMVGSGIGDNLALGYAVDFLKAKETNTAIAAEQAKGKPLPEGRTADYAAMVDYASSKAYSDLSSMIRKRMKELTDQKEAAASVGTKTNTSGGKQDNLEMFQTPEQAAADAAGMAETDRFLEALTTQKIEAPTWVAAFNSTGKKLQNKPRLIKLAEDVVQGIADGQFGIRTFADGKKRLVGRRANNEMSALTPLASRHGYKSSAEVSRTIQNTIMPAMEWLIAQKEGGKVLGERQTALAGGEQTRGGLSNAELEKRYPQLAGVAFHGSTLVAAHHFFSTYFDRMGARPEQAAHLTDVAMKVAGLFDKISYLRIAKITGQELQGVSVPGRNLYSSFIGLNPEEIKATGLGEWAALQTLGHELTHANIQNAMANPSDVVNLGYVVRAMQAASGLSPEQRGTIVGDLLQVVLPVKGSEQWLAARADYIHQRMQEAATDPHEMLADMGGILSTGMASGSKIKVANLMEKLMFSGPMEQDFAKGFYVDMTQAMDAVEKWMNYRNDGKLGTQARQMMGNLRQTLSTLENVQKMVDSVNTLRMMEPEQYMALRADANIAGEIPAWQLMPEEPGWRPMRSIIKDVRQKMGLADQKEWEKQNGVQPGFFSRTMATAAQLAEKYPPMKPIISLMFGFRALTEDYLHSAMAGSFLIGPDRFGKMHLDMEGTGLKTLLHDGKVNDFASEVALRKNDNIKAGGDGVLSDQEIRDLAQGKGLSEGQVNDVIQFHRKVEQVMPKVAKTIVQNEREQGALRIAALTVLESSRTNGTRISSKQAKLYGDLLIQAAERPKSLSASARDLIAHMEGVFSPEFTKRVATIALDSLQHVKDLQEQLGNKPGYMPEVRLGKYFVTGYRGKDVAFFNGYETKAEALRKVVQLEKDGMSVSVKDKTDKEGEFAGVRPDMAEHWARIARLKFERAIAGLPEEQQTFLKDNFDMGDAMINELKGRSSQRSLIQRKLVGGREELNMLAGFLHYIQGVTTGMAKSWSKNYAAVELAQPDLLNNPKLHTLAKQHVQNVLYPSGKEWNMLKQANFLYFMGLNPANMVAETTQSFLSYVPYMIEKGMGVGAAYKNLFSSFKEMFHAARKGKFSKTVYDQAMAAAQKRRIVDFGVLQEFYSAEDVSGFNARNLIKSQKMMPVERYAKNAAVWLMHMPRAIYSVVTRLNSRVAFLGAFKHAYEDKGMGFNAAIDFAEQATHATMFGGGPAARPIGMFSNLGKAHGIMGLGYSLQSYTFGMYSMLARFLRNSIDKGVAGPEKAAARKAAGVALATQFVMAGALGMPASTAVLALFNQLFPEAELERKMRTGVGELMNEVTNGDEEAGAFLSDVLMHGVADQTGMDLSGRVGLGTFLGVSPYNGFTWENLTGPTGSLLKNIVQAGQATVQGEPFQAARKLMPTSLRHVLEIYDNTAFRDSRGRLLMDPSQTDRVLEVLGLGPKQLKRLKEADRLQRQSEQVAASEQRKKYDEVVDQLVARNTQGAQQLLAQMAKDSGGMLDTRAAARTIAGLAFSRLNVEDPTQGVGRLAADRIGELRRSMGALPGQEAGAVKRVQDLQGFMMQLGQRPSRQSMRTPALIDQLMQKNPRMTYGEAAARVGQMMGR